MLYEIDEVDNWSEQINDKIIRFRSSNSNDIKCLGRIIGSKKNKAKFRHDNKTYIEYMLQKTCHLNILLSSQ